MQDCCNASMSNGPMESDADTLALRDAHKALEEAQRKLDEKAARQRIAKHAALIGRYFKRAQGTSAIKVVGLNEMGYLKVVDVCMNNSFIHIEEHLFEAIGGLYTECSENEFSAFLYAAQARIRGMLPRETSNL